MDNIPTDLTQAGRKDMVNVLTIICNAVGKTDQWPQPWTQSLITTLPNKFNLKQCTGFCAISLISHPSKVLLRIILNRIKPRAECRIEEEQAGFRETKISV